MCIRDRRGSWLKGLVSLNKKVEISGKNLFRPLLDQKKEDLIFIASYCFDFFIKDPTNQNEKFKRIKLHGAVAESGAVNGERPSVRGLLARLGAHSTLFERRSRSDTSQMDVCLSRATVSAWLRVTHQHGVRASSPL